MKPDKAFILAAGFGTRLRPLTEKKPKPLIDVHGCTLIDHTLNHLQKAGVKDVIVNTHYLAEELRSHLARRESPNIRISHEPEILDTGGGIKNALKYLGKKDFYVLSGDGFWQDGPEKPALDKLAEAWDPEKMDILMLLQPLDTMDLTTGVGDYDLREDGKAVRSKNQEGAYMFTSIRINSPRIFENAPDGPFSYLELMDRAQTNGRLYGFVHDGRWHHISTPKDLKSVRNTKFPKESAA